MADRYDLSDLGAAPDTAAMPDTAAAPWDRPVETNPNGVIPWLIAGGTGALKAASGLKKEIGIGLGAGGGAMILKHMMGRGGGPPAPPGSGPPPSGPTGSGRPLDVLAKPSASLHVLTAEDVAQHSEFARFSPGTAVRRATYEKALMAGPPAAEAAPSARPEPTRDITMIEGGKARAAKAPAAVAPNGPGVGKGLPGTRLARRAQAMERMKAERAAAEPGRQPLKVLEGGAGAPPDAAAASLEAEQAMKEAGIGPAQRAAARAAMAATLEATPAAERAAAIAAFRMTLAREGPGALMGLLMYGPSFLKGQGLGEQMNATSPLLDMLRPSRVLPNAMPQSQQTGGI